MARRARSLDVLVAEVNAYAPYRSTASDGWLGDAAHASRPSRHNPNNAGVVCAQDITNDRPGGCPIHVIVRRIVLAGPPPDCEYIISNRQVAKRHTNWSWEPYTGENPHDKHAHFAVGRGPDSEPTQPYDDTDSWGIAPIPIPPPDDGDDDVAKTEIILYGTDDGKYGWYSVTNAVGLYIADPAAFDFYTAPPPAGLGIPKSTDAGGKPFGPIWQHGVWLVDGPAANHPIP